MYTVDPIFLRETQCRNPKSTSEPGKHHPWASRTCAAAPSLLHRRLGRVLHGLSPGLEGAGSTARLRWSPNTKFYEINKKWKCIAIFEDSSKKTYMNIQCWNTHHSSVQTTGMIYGRSIAVLRSATKYRGLLWFPVNPPFGQVWYFFFKNETCWMVCAAAIEWIRVGREPKDKVLTFFDICPNL